MAKFNEILVGRFNRALQKITGIKGAASTPQLATEIVPSFPLFWGNENRYLESWQLFGALSGITAVAGQFPLVHFRNPSGSNVIAVIQKITLNSAGPAASQFVVEGPNPSTATDDLGSTPSFARFDARGQNNPTIKLTQGTAAADNWPGNNKAWYSVIAPVDVTVDVILDDVQEFPLLPGDAFRMVNFQANQTANFSVQWRERFLEESERT